jgi:hypothetical protein
LLFSLPLVKLSTVSSSYEKALDNALSELDELLRRRRKIDEQISQIRDVALALCRKADGNKTRKEKLMYIFGQLNVGTPKLTDAVKDALYAADPGRRLPAIQVKDLMELRGFDFINFTNPLASVHSTLRRLAVQGVVGSRPEKGAMVYWWNGPRYGARNSLANMLAGREQTKQMGAKIRERVDKGLSKFGIYTRR